MGDDRIRYLLFVSGRWRWRPTKAMRRHGFKMVNLSQATVATAEDKAAAVRLNAEWDLVRTGIQEVPFKFYPPGSVGEGYERAIKLREAERSSKGIVLTKEQIARDDWPRAWKWLEPLFGDVDPKTIQPEHFLSVDPKTRKVTGLIPMVETRVSHIERHRVVKVWRALWKKMATLKYCDAGKDPSMVFANASPMPRQDVWAYREALRLVQGAWRMELRGLAALMAVAWDSMLSPVDARRLTAGQRAREGHGAIFFLDRAKTGRAAVGTLSQWSEAILAAYLKELGMELHDSAPLFRTAGTEPGPRGGRRWLPRPYGQNKLGQDFRKVRAAVFGKTETRQLADMRRSGAFEADAGGATDTDLANKMANTIDKNRRLRKTYNPVNVASVHRVDDAREVGRTKLAEHKQAKSVMGTKKEVS